MEMHIFTEVSDNMYRFFILHQIFAHSSRKPGTMTTYAAFITCVRFFTCPSMLKCYAQRALYLVSGEPIKLLKTTSLTTSLVL